MIRYTKFIHIFTISILVLTFMSLFGATRSRGSAIRCIPVYETINHSNYVAKYDTVILSNIVGKNFYDVFDTKKLQIKTIPNRKNLIKLLPVCTSTDTVTIISWMNWGAKMYSDIKFNNMMFSITYDRDGQYKLGPIAKFYKPTACAGINTDMIMLNVFFEWDSDIVMCMVKSTSFLDFSYNGDYNLAQRFILKDGVITDYQEIKFDDAFYWFLSGCYSRDSIPTKYLRDLRYDSPDSLITRYLQGVCYEETYWKRYTK